MVTAVYFVPEIQLKLADGYSWALIEDLNTYDFPLRGIPFLIYLSAACYMFIKVERIRKGYESPIQKIKYSILLKVT